jgi:hypothetical protein
MFSLKGAKEWAAGFLDGSSSNTGRPNLEKFLEEVDTENTEHLIFHSQNVDAKFEEDECKPTYVQLSQKSIISEAQRNLKVLQALENILQER